MNAHEEDLLAAGCGRDADELETAAINTGLCLGMGGMMVIAAIAFRLMLFAWL